MRYTPEHKAEVHQRIVKDASRRVRAEGRHILDSAVLGPPQEVRAAHPGIVLLGCDDDGIESERSEPADR